MFRSGFILNDGSEQGTSEFSEGESASGDYHKGVALAISFTSYAFGALAGPGKPLHSHGGTSRSIRVCARECVYVWLVAGLDASGIGVVQLLCRECCRVVLMARVAFCSAPMLVVVIGFQANNELKNLSFLVGGLEVTGDLVLNGQLIRESNAIVRITVMFESQSKEWPVIGRTCASVLPQSLD